MSQFTERWREGCRGCHHLELRPWQFRIPREQTPMSWLCRAPGAKSERGGPRPCSMVRAAGGPCGPDAKLAEPITFACQGGLCKRRAECANYVHPNRDLDEPAGRLCEKGVDRPTPLRIQGQEAQA
jgi:hypothetical protein